MNEFFGWADLTRAIRPEFTALIVSDQRIERARGRSASLDLEDRARAVAETLAYPYLCVIVTSVQLATAARADLHRKVAGRPPTSHEIVSRVAAELARSRGRAGLAFTDGNYDELISALDVVDAGRRLLKISPPDRHESIVTVSLSPRRRLARPFRRGRRRS